MDTRKKLSRMNVKKILSRRPTGAMDVQQGLARGSSMMMDKSQVLGVLAETMRKSFLSTQLWEQPLSDEDLDAGRGSLNSIRCDAQYLEELISDTAAESRTQANK